MKEWLAICYYIGVFIGGCLILLMVGALHLIVLLKAFQNPTFANIGMALLSFLLWPTIYAVRRRVSAVGDAESDGEMNTE